jgi:hypothetical protein
VKLTVDAAQLKIETPSGFKVGRKHKSSQNTVPLGTEPDMRCFVPDGTQNVSLFISTDLLRLWRILEVFLS